MYTFAIGGKKLLTFLGVGIALPFAPIMFAQSSRPVNLECEARTTPLGMDAEKPLLSWKIEDSPHGAKQTAYQIQVASTDEKLASGKADVWDSGRVQSENPADPGFHIIRLHPIFDKTLGSLDFSYDSAYVVIHSDWKISGSESTWNLIIPANSTGHLPLSSEQAQDFTIDGQPLAKSNKIHALPGASSGIEYALPAGNYRFEVKLP